MILILDKVKLFLRVKILKGKKLGIFATFIRFLREGNLAKTLKL